MSGGAMTIGRRGRGSHGLLLGGVDRTKLLRWGLSIALFFGLWELLGQSGEFIAIVPPSVVLPDLWEEILHGELLAATFGTLSIAAIGFLIGAILGVTFGAILGVSKRWSEVFDPLVSASFSVPVSMFIPLIAVYFGLEVRSKVILVLLFNIFVIIINTAVGIREVPASVIEMARAFEVDRSGMYRRVILPWASPYIITGLRIGLGRSVQGAILADLFFRTQNLGLVIRNAAGSFDMSQLLGSVFFITIIAAGTMGLARIVEWRLLRWKTG
jgi:ABC-type nitrate/sulfonate/bicarbonate transport system permease component